MASNYSELKTELQRWTAINELSDNVETYIKNAESKINRLLRVREMRQLAKTTYGPHLGSRFISLPNDCQELRTLRIKSATSPDTSYTEIKRVFPEEMYEKYTATAGMPDWYCLRDQIEVNRLADDDYDILIHYMKRWDIAGDSTNWLLTNHPDIYLAGARYEAWSFHRNPEERAVSRAEFRDGIDELNFLDSMSEDEDRKTELSTASVGTIATRRYGYDITSE